MGTRRERFRKLAGELARVRPDLDDPAGAIVAGLVTVDGSLVTNPDSLVRSDAAIVVRRRAPLRGEAKLRAALEAFDVPVPGRVVLDVGAAAGGFTRVLLEAGARRVYAVDVGHGQLIGSLRQDSRVVNLESTNLGDLGPAVVPEAVEVITVDLSYLSLARAAGQLEVLEIAADADLVALVKPMFELGLPQPPTDPVDLKEAVVRARRGVEGAGWAVEDCIESPVRGARGAVELLLHATRSIEGGR